MLVKTIKDYTDRETKQVFRVTDKNPTRKVSDERGAELIAKGVAIEVVNKKEKKAKVVEEPTEPKEETTPTTDENLDVESNKEETNN